MSSGVWEEWSTLGLMTQLNSMTLKKLNTEKAPLGMSSTGQNESDRPKMYSCAVVYT